MPAAKLRTTVVALLLTAAVAACGADVAPLPPAGPQPLPTGTGYMRTANGLALPAKISERFISVTFEEIFLDSAKLEIDGSRTQYVQRYRTRVNHNGLQDRAEFHVDAGTMRPARRISATPHAKTFGGRAQPTDPVISGRPARMESTARASGREPPAPSRNPPSNREVPIRSTRRQRERGSSAPR